jgi:hypothetical protein
MQYTHILFQSLDLDKTLFPPSFRAYLMMVIPETFFCFTVVYPFLIDCLSLSRIVILYIEMCQTYTDVNILGLNRIAKNRQRSPMSEGGES